MKDSPSAPPPPDYRGAAQEQGAANVEATRLSGRISNPSVVTPYGSSQVLRGYRLGSDGVPFEVSDQDETTVVQRLNPESQRIFDQQQRVREGMAGLGSAALTTAQRTLGTGFDASGLPSIQTSIDNPNVNGSLDTSGVARMPVNAGTTGQEAIMARLRPELDRRRKALQTQMLNEGHVRGNEGYNEGMALNDRAENDALSQAALHGIGLDMSANQQGFGQALARGQFGNQAAGQQFGQNLQSGQFGNTAQQQAMAQALYQRNLPLNEISALMSGSQIQNPQFQGYTGQNVQAPNIAGATAQQGAWDQGLYNSQVGQANSGNNAMVGLASAAAYAF